LRHIASSLRVLLIAAAAATHAGAALAGPGAHGPNGEHLDGPAATPASTAPHPRVEAKSELFELVATLAGGELSLLIDRYETNEPVLNAQVEIESAGLKAKARFHADHGDYAVDDAALLGQLAKSGTHPLVITVIAGQDADLLDARLVVGNSEAEDAGHGHSHAGDGAALPGHVHGSSARTTWVAGGVVAALTVLAVVLLRRNRSWVESSRRSS
jgi:hypothetical protein